MVTILSDLDRLIAIEDIRMLKARRDYALDTKDWATYEALHAPHHVSHNDGFPREEGAAYLTAMVRKRLDPVITVHHSHSAVIEILTPDTASGIWGMEDYIYWSQGDEDHWLHGAGFYHETYERLNGVWVFTTRRLKRLHVRTSEGAKTGPAGFGV